MSRLDLATNESAARGVPRLLGMVLSAFALVAAPCLFAYAAYFPLFGLFQWYDDAGYWLISIRSYHLHGSLYHDTFAQVGPLFYEFWSGIYSITGLPITLDSGRALTLVVWAATSLLFGIAVWHFTSRLILGLLAEALTFLLLLSLINEPMEPAGLAHMFTGCALVGAAIVVRGRQRLGMAVIGVSVVAVTLTKVNIGLFLGTALLYAVIICWPGHQHPQLRQVIGAAIVFTPPILLMWQFVAEDWVRWYLLLEIISLIGFVGVVAAGWRPGTTIQLSAILWCVGAGVATGALVTIGVLINGTSLSQVLEGAFISQRNLAKIAQIPLTINSADVIVAAMFAAVAIAVALRRYSPGGTIRVAVGIWLCVSLVGSLRYPPLDLPGINSQSYLFAAPLAWVPLTSRSSNNDRPLSFARVFICGSSILGFLEAFPGAASQQSWACLLFIPVALLCISDGMEMLSGKVSRKTVRALPKVPVALAWFLVVVLIVLPLWSPVQQLFSTDRTLYNKEPSLGLPGAQDIRLSVYQVAVLRQVTSSLKLRCSTFESMPGLSSFYFLSGEDPPTDLNTTQWWKLLDSRTQDRIVVRLRPIRGLCVLVSPTLISFWDQGHPLAQTSLVRYLEHNFVLSRKIEGVFIYFEVDVRRR